MPRRSRSLLSATTLFLAACSATYFEAGAPAKLFSHHVPQEIQIGRKDGHMVVLAKPTLARDTIWGRIVGDSIQQQTGIAVSDVEWSLVRGTRVAPGSVLIILGLFATGVLALTIHP
jgi:hypothetical protein